MTTYTVKCDRFDFLQDGIVGWEKARAIVIKLRNAALDIDGAYCSADRSRLTDAKDRSKAFKEWKLEKQLAKRNACPASNEPKTTAAKYEVVTTYHHTTITIERERS